MRPNKSFGQHFLVSEPVIRQIVGTVEGFSGVLEVGPGPGVLTGPLTDLVEKVIAVEIDDVILPVLQDMAPDAQVVHSDALQVDLGALLDQLPEPRALVSNMPYNITGPLLTAFAAQRGKYSRATLMMQKEVADRILSPAGDRNRGSLSVFLEAQFEIRKLCIVPPGAFLPPPKVTSAVLEFFPLEREFSSSFFKMVRAGFAQPRKTLVNNLKSMGLNAGHLEQLDLSASIRPHQLTLEQWNSLSKLLFG